MEKLQSLQEEIQWKIDDLEKELNNTEEDLKSKLDGNPHNIVKFGLAKTAEDITVIHSKLELLYEIQTKIIKLL